MTETRRAREQDNDLGEELIKLGNESMLRTAGRKLGAAAFDDARIATQTTLGEQGSAHISKQALYQGRMVLLAGLLHLRERIGDHSDGMSETETVAVQILRGS